MLYFLMHRHLGKVNHCRIRSKHDRGQIKYYLIDGATFDSLYSLITYYRTYPLRIQVNCYKFKYHILV
jgi:phosphatidylinositol phospholipase C, gamma-1